MKIWRAGAAEPSGQEGGGLPAAAVVINERGERLQLLSDGDAAQAISEVMAIALRRWGWPTELHVGAAVPAGVAAMLSAGGVSITPLPAGDPRAAEITDALHLIQLSTGRSDV